MKTPGILSLLLLALSTPALAEQDFEKEYAELKKMKACIETVRIANQRYQEILETWYVEDSALSVVKNFRYLLKQHDRYFAAVHEFEGEDLPPADDIEEIGKAIGRLDQTHQKTLDDLDAVQKADGLFTVSLPPIDDGLERAGGEFKAAQGLCDPELNAQIEVQIQSIANLRAQTKDMILYVNQAAAKRSNFFRAVLEAKKVRLLKAYSDATHVPLNSLMGKVNAMLAADTLQGRIQAWWTVAMLQDGVGRGAVNRDLQYVEGLRNLRIDLELGERFQKELEDLSNLSPSVRQAIQGDLTLYLKQIRDHVAALETGGYEAVFAKQKRMSQRRRELASLYPLACLKALDAFDSASAVVTSEGTFRAMESLYKLQVATCRRP